ARIPRSAVVIRFGPGVAAGSGDSGERSASSARTPLAREDSPQMSPMRRREFLLWAATSVSAIGLAACQPTAPAGPTAAPAAKPTTAPAPAPTTAPAAAATAPAAKPTTAPAAAAAPTTAPAAAAAPGGTLVYGLSGDFDDTLDPQVTNFDTSIRVTLNICEPLVWEPEPGKFVPGLADSWDVSSDAKVYTFNLKKGVKFHD